MFIINRKLFFFLFLVLFSIENWWICLLVDNEDDLFKENKKKYIKIHKKIKIIVYKSHLNVLYLW
jgi:hypothetical protein